MEDACFNGGFIRRLIYLTKPSVWRWHILGQRLPEGTQCQFTTTVNDGETRPMPRLQMSTSCTIGDNNNSTVIPATCLSESLPLGCPCQCSDGFRIDMSGDVSDSLTCKSKSIHAAMAVQRKASTIKNLIYLAYYYINLYDCTKL